MNKFSLLTLLLNTPSISGYEKLLGISSVVAKRLGKISRAQINPDGSVIVRLKKNPKLPTVLISAHIDEVGFFISKKITNNQLPL